MDIDILIMVSNMKNMRFIIIIVLGLLFGVGIYYGYFVFHSNQLVKKFKNSEDGLFVLGHPGCIYCEMFEPILKRSTKNYSVEYTYINTYELTRNDYRKVLEFLEVSENDFGTPYIVMLKDNCIEQVHLGYMDDFKFYEFMKKSKLIDNETEFINPYSNIIGLTGETFLETIKKDTNQIILVGRAGEEQTEKALGKLNQYNKDYEILFLNPSNIGIYYQDFIESLDGYFNKENVQLPIVIVVKNNNLIEEIDIHNIEHIKEYRTGVR